MSKKDMNKTDLRAELRLEVSNKGWLVLGNNVVPCMLRDMSDTGLLIICSEQIEVGQTLRFFCELFPKKVLDCMIEIVHISDVGVGAKIIDLDVRRSNLIQVYLQEVYALGGKIRR